MRRGENSAGESAGESAPLRTGVAAAPVASVPSEMPACLAGSLPGGLDLVSEQTAERPYKIVRRASLDDVPKRVGEAEGHERVQGSDAREDDVHEQPVHVRAIL